MMVPFNIHILGCGSALPTLRHNPSSQVVELGGRYYMIDCGEGTQIALRRTGLNFNKLHAVFISHLHGDHCLGLVGMISSFGLQGRRSPLHIYAPQALSLLLPPLLDFFAHEPGFEVLLHTVDTTRHALVYQDEAVSVYSLPLEHRMPCSGFLFREQVGKRHILPEATRAHRIPFSQMKGLQEGLDGFTPQGERIPNALLTTAPEPVRSYAYCADTRYIPSLPALLQDVTVLYHESTFCADKIDAAEQYFHSTARQAATVARDAGVQTLLLGHYSQRYATEEPFLREAQEVFSNAKLTQEGMIFSL